MKDYRTPEEEHATDQHRKRVQAVLAEALANATSVIIAMRLGESTEVVESWIERLWNGLRDGLSDDHPKDPNSTLMHEEDRLAAIVYLLEDRANDDAERAIAAIREAGDA